jgi:hypothetical protein
MEPRSSLLRCMSQLLALKGPSTYTCQCLLIGYDQTCRGRALTAEFDPERTLAVWLHKDLFNRLVSDVLD